MFERDDYGSVDEKLNSLLDSSVVKLDPVRLRQHYAPSPILQLIDRLCRSLDVVLLVPCRPSPNPIAGWHMNQAICRELDSCQRGRSHWRSDGLGSAALRAGQRGTLLAADWPEPEFPADRAPACGGSAPPAGPSAIPPAHRAAAGTSWPPPSARRPGSSRPTARANGVRCADEVPGRPCPAAAFAGPGAGQGRTAPDRVHRAEDRARWEQRSGGAPPKEVRPFR